MLVDAPGVLGRGVVVDAGADPSASWSGAPVVTIDEGVLAEPRSVVEELHRLWAARSPVVVALAVDPGRFRHPRTVGAEVWTLTASFEILEDRLHFLVWANNYDARGERIAEPIWWWGRKAQRLGCSPVEAGASAAGSMAGGAGTGSVGDVVLADGTAAWVDGGPRGPLDSGELRGAGVVHRDSIEVGRLTLQPPPVAPDSELAADQLAAVGHPSGPARIIAPAGSGKTRVLTQRLRHLVVDRGWERDVTLAVAYNKRAQQELDFRCGDFAPRTRTLNSLGYAVLSDHLGYRPGVLSERETRRLVERFAPIRRRRANTDPIAPYLEALGRVRLGLIDPAIVEEERDDVPGLAEMFPLYRQELRSARGTDFDDQVYAAVEALLSDGALRVRWQGRCRHLLVDEFQDLTPAHVLMLRLLASPALDVFGVGDDDQVIYGHAGADPAFLIDYASLFPSAGDHPLQVNYRCPPEVVTSVRQLLSYNRRRVAKTIRSGRSDRSAFGAAEPAAPASAATPAPASAITSAPASTDASPPAAAPTPGLVVRRKAPLAAIETLVDEVRRSLDAGVAPGEIAVLSRVNSLILAPQVALVSAGVPVRDGIDAGVLDRTGTRAALAYLRIAASEDGQIEGSDINEILRRPSRGLPPWFSDRIRRRRVWSVQALLGISASVPDKDAPKVESLVDDIVALRSAASRGTARAAGSGVAARAAGSGITARAAGSGMKADTVSLLATVQDDIGLGKAMGLLDSSQGEGASHLDDLEALQQVAALHPEAATFEMWLREVLSNRLPASQGAVTLPAGEGAVTLATVHRVKGMEWDHVFVWGASEGIMPHRLAEDLEEERRVFHVALTRGRDRVVVLADARRSSSFLGELDGSAPKRPAGAGAEPTGASGNKLSGGPSSKPTGASGKDKSDRKATLADRSTLEPETRQVEDALKAWRTSRARTDKVPPYVVASDRTLREIALRRPKSLVRLREVPGIGPSKLETYGEEILAVLDQGSVVK